MRVPRSPLVHRADDRRDRRGSGRDVGATSIVTTEKDAVRLEPLARGACRARGRCCRWRCRSSRRPSSRHVAADAARCQAARVRHGSSCAGPRRRRRSSGCCRWRSCAPAARRSAGSSTTSTAFIGASRSTNLAHAFPSKTATRSGGAGARDVRALRQPAARAAEVRHAVAASRCWRASRARARSASGRRYEQGRGVLFFTGHFGYWEMQAIAQRAARAGRCRCWRGRSTTRSCTSMLERIRTRTGNSVIYRQGAIRKVLRELAANHGVAILIDQHLHTPDAVYVDFFQPSGGDDVGAGGAGAAHRRAGDSGVRAAAAATAATGLSTSTPVEPPRDGFARRGPRVHAALHRRARDVRPAASRPVAVDAPPLARARAA